MLVLRSFNTNEMTTPVAENEDPTGKPCYIIWATLANHQDCASSVTANVRFCKFGEEAYMVWIQNHHDEHRDVLVFGKTYRKKPDGPYALFPSLCHYVTANVRYSFHHFIYIM